MNQLLIQDLLLEIGLAVNKKCTALLDAGVSALNDEVKVSPADIIYKIDVEAEEEIVSILEEKAEKLGGVELIAEGIGENDISYYPSKSAEYKWKIICDPIDGSRGLMYGKRPAFFLAAAGPSSAKSLNDMTVSVMVELPIPKQFEFDVLTAVKGEGAKFYRYNKSGESRRVELSASSEKSVEGGFMTMAKYCYPGKDLIAKIEERFLDRLFAGRKENFLPVFDDQYISSGGQLYEIINGHDRFTVDFRASMYRLFQSLGKKQGQVCHPYDLAGVLVAREAGVIVETLDGEPFDCSLTTDQCIDWVAYANESIKKQCRETLYELLKEEGIV